MNIKDIKGYDEFKKHCNFELCTKHYPGWTGVEKYIVITDDAEKYLLETFPEIMRELSPYVVVGRYFSSLNEAERYNNNKHGSQIGLSIDSMDDYEDLAEGFIIQDFAEEICATDAIASAMKHLNPLQKSRVERYFFKGMTITAIAAEDGVHESTARRAIYTSLEIMKKYLS